MWNYAFMRNIYFVVFLSVLLSQILLKFHNMKEKLGEKRLVSFFTYKVKNFMFRRKEDEEGAT